MKFTPRERVRTLFSHELPDRMPITLDVGGGLGVTNLYQRKILNPQNIFDVPDYFDFDIRVVDVPLAPNQIDPREYFSNLHEGIEIDAFGVGREYSEAFPHGLIYSPLGKVTNINQIIDYPLPSYQFSPETNTQISNYHKKGYAVSVAAGSINEWCYYLRSMEVFFTDLANNPEIATVILDKITTLSAQVGADLAKAGADIVCFYGDVGGQHGMLISPKMWRKWIKPRWDQIFSSVRMANADAFIFFHSCGNIFPIIPDLIELGVDILNPVQPECMNPFEIKQTFGSKINLWGGIGLQDTLSQLNSDQVRTKTMQLIDAWSRDGGALVTTTNSLPLDIPWQNVETLVQTVREYSSRVFSNLS